MHKYDYADCDNSYIGVTRRRLSTHMMGHQPVSEGNYKVALSEYSTEHGIRIKCRSTSGQSRWRRNVTKSRKLGRRYSYGGGGHESTGIEDMYQLALI
jgi:hypothetical protein